MIGEQPAGRGGEQDLASVGAGADAGSTRDRQPDVTITGHLWVSGVDAHAHLDLDSVGPDVLGQRRLGGSGSLGRLTGAGEGHEERLRLAVDHHSLVGVERLFQQTAVLSDHLLVSLAETVLQLRGALNVGEEQSDGAVREFGHAPIVSPRSADGKSGVRADRP